MIKKFCLLLLLSGIAVVPASQAQLLKKLEDAVNKNKTSNSSSSTPTSSSSTSSSSSSSAGLTNVTQSDAGNAIKEALSKGVTAGIQMLNKKDGFFGNEAYKLLLPPDAVKIGNTLRSIGLGSQVDQAILTINRAAEKAVGYAAPIFVDAISQMSITDALNIVKGGNTSATDYFKSKTTDKLKTAFAPAVKGSLDSTLATKYYTDIVTTYNKLPTVKTKADPDLQSYVTGKAVDALFDQIGKEEENIRANPAAQTTALLQKVFGAVTGSK